MVVFPDDPAEQGPELAYYRAIEDHFANLRDLPHDLSPKDWQLLRTWWRDQVPLSAVTTGITEVVNQQRQRDADNPVVSLHYCRHAVRRHARRLAEMRVGQESTPGASPVASPAVTGAVAGLVLQLQRVVASGGDRRPRVAAAITTIIAHLEAAAELPEAMIEEHLFSLEIALLEGCRHALDETEQAQVERQACQELPAGLTEGERQRLLRATRDRLVRELLGLPRLELASEPEQDHA